MGATPASIANAASEWIRPGWDQAHNTVAATIVDDDRADAELLQQIRAPAADDGHDRLLQLSCLFQHRVRATSQGPQRHHGAGCLGVPRGVHSQARGGVEHRGKLLATEPGPDGFGRGDDQAEDLLLGLGGGIDR